MLIEVRDHGGTRVEADTIDKQIFHHALDIIARFGKWDPFHLIDCIYIGIAWITVLLHPLPDSAPASIIAGKG